MCTYKKICITNRHLVDGDFLEKINEIAHSDIDAIILREKDLTENEYEKLAAAVIKICAAAEKLCILHTFVSVAIHLKHPYIQLPFNEFMAMDDKNRNFFKVIGVSTHSVDEAINAQKRGASYVTASHIFPTDCKIGLEPRGLNFLKEVCEAVSIPVYALGGINADNTEACIKCGAAGICMMSELMRKNRYARQITMSEIGEAGQAKLHAAKVLVVGAGGLGSPVLQYLSGAGIGTIGIADADEVSITNIHRQIIHPESNVGKNKAVSAAEAISKINSDVKTIVYPFRITPDNIDEIVKDYDFIIDAVDNFETKFLINDACVIAEKPFCHAGVIRANGQVMTYVSDKGPCMRCVFDEVPEKGSVPTCVTEGVLGPACGVIGCVQALEAIKYITGTGKLLTGSMYIFDALTMKSRVAAFPNKNDACRVCGQSADIKSVIDNRREYVSQNF